MLLGIIVCLKLGLGTSEWSLNVVEGCWHLIAKHHNCIALPKSVGQSYSNFHSCGSLREPAKVQNLID